jgi:glycerophosphoryl diester phosphodiesterase
MKKFAVGLTLLTALLASCGNQTPAPAGVAKTQAVRVGNHQIAAHAGDREGMPNGWLESEWENSIQAINSALGKAARYVELDLQLNRNPAAITDATPYGILYLHHNRTCEVINASGQGTGTKFDIASAAPSSVDRCAERLENVINASTNAFPYQMMLEMKADTGYTEWIPYAVYHLLKKKGIRTTGIITSLNEGMLVGLRNLAAADGVTLNLTRVYGATTKPTRSDLDRAKSLGFKYVNANVNDWFQSDVDYAKSIGLYVLGWHWSLTTPAAANATAVNLDLDIMVTDAITDLQAYGWR